MGPHIAGFVISRMEAPLADLSAFRITRKWPAQDPGRIQLYSLPTPNGVKVSVMLEETGLPYEPHLVSFETDDQKSPEAGDLVRIADFPHVTRALNSFLSRPAVVQGVGIPSRAGTS